MPVISLLMFFHAPCNSRFFRPWPELDPVSSLTAFRVSTSRSSSGKQRRPSGRFSSFISRSCRGRKILVCNTGCLLGEVIGSFEIFAEKLQFSFNVAREQWL